MNCSALILAAGASTRLGLPKQLVQLGGETLLQRSIRIAVEAGCAPIITVLGAFEEMIRSECNFQDVLILSNPDWMEGMATSLCQGVRMLEEASGILVMTCDMPAVTADHLRALAASGRVMASSYGGRNGVPAYLPRALFPELLKLRGDAGARDILQSACTVNFPGGTFDIDTMEDLAEVRRKFS